MERSRDIAGWEAWGAVFIVVAGSLLHFAYEWSGQWHPVALVAAVNESIWEHLKLAFWPGLAWALLAPPGLRLSLWERLAASGFGLLLVAALIVAFFKGYTAVLGRNFLVLDIGTFIVAVVAGQIGTAWLTKQAVMGRVLTGLGLLLMLVQLAAYGHFTFHPPQHWLFADPHEEQDKVHGAGPAEPWSGPNQSARTNILPFIQLALPQA